MSTLETNLVQPSTGTTLTLGASGDTVDVPGTEVKTNKISPTSGTGLQLGDSGDTITIPSGATITNSGTATGFGVSDPLSFQAYRSGNLAVSATTQTELVYNAEVTDPSSKYDTSTGRYTPGVAGTYFVNAGVSFAPDSNIGVGASGYLKIRKSGSGTVEYGQISNQGSGDSNDEAWNTAAVIELGSSDYISVWWYHTANAGNMLSVQSWFSGFRIG